MLAAAPVLWDVVEEHLAEAAFLAVHREEALESPRCAIGWLEASIEERLLGHLDGLAAAGAPARERLLAPGLAGDDPAVAFAAALAWLEAPGRDALDAIVARIAAGGRMSPGQTDLPERLRGRAQRKAVAAYPDSITALPFALSPSTPAPAQTCRGLRSGQAESKGRQARLKLAAMLRRALTLARRPRIEEELLELAASADPAQAAVALEALASRRAAVPAELVARPGPATVSALRAARCAGPRVAPLVEWALRSDVAALREAAVESGLVLGLRAAWAACRRIAEAHEPGAGRALLLLALGGAPEDVDRIARAAAVDALRPQALFALGFTGRAAAAEACVPYLRRPEVARLASEAFSAITGLALQGEYRTPEPPPPEEPIPFEQENLSANLVPSPEEALPMPAAAAIEGWWKRARTRFDPAVRYFAGRPLDAGVVRAALATGPLRRRHALGLELEIRSRGAFALATRGWAADQRRYEAAHPLPSGPALSLPFEKLLTS